MNLFSSQRVYNPLAKENLLTLYNYEYHLPMKKATWRKDISKELKIAAKSKMEIRKKFLVNVLSTRGCCSLSEAELRLIITKDGNPRQKGGNYSLSAQCRPCDESDVVMVEGRK